MNYRSLLALCITSAALSQTALANNALSSQYSSTLHPQAGQANTLLHPPTDITIINATSDYIYAIVPNSPVYDYITPGYNDHIYNYSPDLMSTYVILQDAYHNTIFSNNVCRLAIMTVYGYAGQYSINIDTDLCN